MGVQETVGEMVSIRVLTTLTPDYNLPSDMKMVWDVINEEQTSLAEEVFKNYIQDGWIAFKDDENGRRQIFEFDASLKRILLLPPLGGGCNKRK